MDAVAAATVVVVVVNSSVVDASPDAGTLFLFVQPSVRVNNNGTIAARYLKILDYDYYYYLKKKK